MARSITSDVIVHINELYREIGTYAGVARILGLAPTTVKKYVSHDFVPAENLNIKRADIGACREIVENFNMSFNDFNNSMLLELTEEEAAEMEEIWREISL